MAKKLKTKTKKKAVKSKSKPKAKAHPKKVKTKAKAKAAPIKARKKIEARPPVFKSITRNSLEIQTAKTAEERPLSASEINKLRDSLAQKQEELSEIVHRKKEEQEFQQEEPEIGDEADIATRSVEKELLFDITDAEKQNLDGIEAALRKIEKNVYGRCESCQRTIPRLRLEVMPWARYCISCQAKNETPFGSGSGNAE
jgi:DnaK suppressor protein